jgi:hypothetical protein
MRMPGFTAEASMYRSPTYLTTDAAKPARPDGVIPAWPYLCGIECVCDPGQTCYPGLFSCSCEASHLQTQPSRGLLEG